MKRVLKKIKVKSVGIFGHSEILELPANFYILVPVEKKKQLQINEEYYLKIPNFPFKTFYITASAWLKLVKDRKVFECFGLSSGAKFFLFLK